MTEREKEIYRMLYGLEPNCDVTYPSFNISNNLTTTCTSTQMEAPKKNDCIAKRFIHVPMSVDYVKAIYVDEIERVVVVAFRDGGKEVVKCSESDEFDITVGVALGISRHLFGHTRFYKHVVAKKVRYTKTNKYVPEKGDYKAYCRWCKDNHKRLASETTFKKNKSKYMAKMKGEN